jgi:predicted ATPase
MRGHERGSEWRRWDLHIHTPGTKKNDNFEGSTLNEKWENFYSAISDYIGDGSDPLKSIVAVGITDYLSIENYQKVVSDNRLPDTIKLIVPNIEMRMLPMAHEAPINIHVIFDPEITNDIENRFLSKLSFQHDSTNYSASKSELIRLGKAMDSTLNDQEAYKKGIEQFVVSKDTLDGVFRHDPELRDHVLILVSNSTGDGVSGAANHSDYFDTSTGQSQMTAFRQSVYQFVDAIFSATPNDIAYFIGKKSGYPASEVILSCGRLKPCVHGSDAHDNAALFEPDQNRYCWIKADPVFNGLKQIVYEPEERVRIGALKPENKSDYFVIDRVEFDDSDFQVEPVYFNDKLTCIIGGKSTGKSILLHNLALTVDKAQAEEKVSKTTLGTKIINNLKVYWADEEDTDRKIVYLPQTYLNRLSDEQEEKTEIDSIIQEIILQSPAIHKIFDETAKAIKDYKSDLDKMIYDLLEIHGQLTENEEKKKGIGDKKGIEVEIGKIKTQKEMLSIELSISDDELKAYDVAVEQIVTSSRTIELLQEEIEEIQTIDSLVVPVKMDYEFSNSTGALIESIIAKAIKSADSIWKTEKKAILDVVNAEKVKSVKELKKQQATRDSLKEKVQGNQAITELTERLRTESEKLTKIIELEKQHMQISEKAGNLIAKVIESIDFFKQQHTKFAEAVKQDAQSISDDLEFSVEVPFRSEVFVATLKELIDIRSLKLVLVPDEFSETAYTPAKLQEIIEKVLAGELRLIKKNTPESALRNIIADWYNTVYSVMMDGDTIDVMSPGKKALVLLKLLISLAESNCPILIDQPEDDLDNRSIFNDLIQLIKTKKKDRQIIIVTHNANIVLGSDAEEIIVANQNGKDSPQCDRRFEYRSGSIENAEPILNATDEIASGILNSQGIQQHICDILEGGVKAFELRKHKYHI